MTNYNPHSNIKFSSISSSCSSPNSSAAINSIMVDDWGLNTMFKQILQKFKGDIKSTFSHLATVHNETCGCQIGLSSHAEVTNKVWNQKKVPFMELQKQSGLDFDDNILYNIDRLYISKLSFDAQVTTYKCPKSF